MLTIVSYLDWVEFPTPAHRGRERGDNYSPKAT